MNGQGTPASSALRIVVLGYIVRGPLGGLVWHHLQYLLGLHDLGHDVVFLEDFGDDGWACYDPSLGQMTDDPSFGLRWTTELFDRVSLGDRWAYFDAPRGTWLGPFAGSAVRFASDADIILNFSAVNTLRDWASGVRVRVLIDTDPVFTQVRHLADPAAMEQARLHDAWFTFGENVGGPGAIPDDGLPWSPTRQPIVLDRWGLGPPPPKARYTTVMQWDSYPAVEHAGVRYGMKSESFAIVESLPSLVDVELELAVGSASAPRERLGGLGWHPLDPSGPTRDAWAFQDYVRASRAEFTVAKQGYVVSRSGWFSERSANYLASGRPVVTQDTGFAAHIPTGLGLLAFSTLDGARAAVEDVEARYGQHAAAAREVAASRFDHRLVLGELLARIGRSS